MAPFILSLRLSLRITRVQWLPLILRALLLLFATFCFITAIRMMPLADALAIVFVAPFIVLLFGKFYLGEDVGPRRIAACFVGFVGVLFVIQPSFAAFADSAWYGSSFRFLHSRDARALKAAASCGAAIPYRSGRQHFLHTCAIAGPRLRL